MAYRKASRRHLRNCCNCYSGMCIDDPGEQCGFCTVWAAFYSIIDYFIPISLVSLLLWLLLRPNNLRPRVDAAVLTQFSLANATSKLDYDLAVDLSFHNTHKHFDVRYFDLTAVASYGGTRLGPSVDVLQVFVQVPMATNVIHIVFQGSAAQLAPAASEVFAREAANGSFNVLVTVTSTVMYKIPFQKPVYHYYHDCYIRFPASQGAGTPAATVLTPGTLCSTATR